MPPTESTTPAPGELDRGDRKRLGAWYTPDELVDLVVERTVTPEWLARRRARSGRRELAVLDPACGDGRFLAAVARRVAHLDPDAAVTLNGVDVDGGAIATARRTLPCAELLHADALDRPWGCVDSSHRTFDLVIGNPPFLSQMAASTTRGGASRHGGGPYADVAAEFLALSIRLADDRGGRVALVLPQSILASRDAAPVRARVDDLSRMIWSWWSSRRSFDADVFVCALGFERTTDARPASNGNGTWAGVVADALGIPEVPALRTAGKLVDRAALNANFRDEYYGLVPAVSDGADGPPLVTSGLIDPARCHWGQRPVRFAKQVFTAPRVDIGRLDERMQAWARRKLVPKVLVASQTTMIEAVADPTGAWLPGVPVTTITPLPTTAVWEIAAVLTSPVASAIAWHGAAGTGLSARTLRLGPALLGEVPWPAGDLADAVAALQDHDLRGCARAVHLAYGIGEAIDGTGEDQARRLTDWWSSAIRGERSASIASPT